MKTPCISHGRLAALCLACFALLVGGASSGRSQGTGIVTDPATPSPDQLLERISSFPVDRDTRNAGILAVQKAMTDLQNSAQTTRTLLAAGTLPKEQADQQIRAALDAFRRDAKLAWLTVVARPDGCTCRWKPLYGGTWTVINGSGTFVGIGVNLVEISKPGFKTSTDKVMVSVDSILTRTLDPGSP